MTTAHAMRLPTRVPGSVPFVRSIPHTSTRTPLAAIGRPRSESTRLGRKLAKIIAQERKQGTPRNLVDMRSYYKKLFPNGTIPANFEIDLAWAEEHPEIFQPLIDNDIFPLEPKWMSPNVYTVSEFFWRRWNTIPEEQRARFAAAEVQYLIDFSYVRSARADSDYADRILKIRPDLIHCLRPSEKGKLYEQARLIRYKRTMKPDSKTPEPFFKRPGCFGDFNVKGLARSGPNKNLYRVVWNKFATADEAIDYFLNQGEWAQLVHHNPTVSIFRLARQILQTSASELVSQARTAVESTFCPNKFYVSLSEQPLEYVDRGCPNQCYVQVQTDRAFSLQIHSMAAFIMHYNESEHGLPLGINPNEIKKIVLRLNGQEITIALDWDHDSLQVVTTIHTETGNETHTYRFDQKTRKYNKSTL